MSRGWYVDFACSSSVVIDNDRLSDSALRYALCQDGSLLSSSLKQKRAFRMRDCIVAERAKRRKLGSLARSAKVVVVLVFM
jgi:hypothetical protein